MPATTSPPSPSRQNDFEYQKCQLNGTCTMPLGLAPTTTLPSDFQPMCDTTRILERLRENENYFTEEAAPEDLVWVPSFSRYAERCRSKDRTSTNLDIALPEGFPTTIEGPAVWTGDDLAQDPDRWIVHLDENDILEVESAADSIVDCGIHLRNISKGNFPLPTLGPKLEKLGESLYEDGPGLFLLRGLNPNKYTSEQNIIIYVGIACYVAEERGVQDERKNMLLHLKDLKDTAAPSNLRQAPYSNVEQPFHTDSAEVISLYTISPAVKGGRSKLASFGNVYNSIASTRPDLLHVLASKTFVFDRFNDETAPPRAVFFPPNDVCNVPTMQMARRPLTGSAASPRSPHLPKLTKAQIDALDAIHFSANNNALHVELKKGDIVFWHNYKVLHGREGFEDPDPISGEKPVGRHLVRLWLRKRGGGVGGEVEQLMKENLVYEPREHENWPVEPITDFAHITTRLRSCGYA